MFSLTVAVIMSVIVILGSVAVSIGRNRSTNDEASNTSSNTSTPNLERNEHNRIREVSLRSTDTIESII